jgi:hypothetical protein
MVSFFKKMAHMLKNEFKKFEFVEVFKRGVIKIIKN